MDSNKMIFAAIIFQILLLLWCHSLWSDRKWQVCTILFLFSEFALLWVCIGKNNDLLIGPIYSLLFMHFIAYASLHKERRRKWIDQGK